MTEIPITITVATIQGWAAIERNVRSFEAPKGNGPVVARAAPAIWLLLVAQTVGQVVGYLAGPGDSPRRVQ